MIKTIFIVVSAVTFFGCGGVVPESNMNAGGKQQISEGTKVSEINEEIMDRGRLIYMQCTACHQTNGEGILGAFPPLANSDYMLADINRTIKTIINGTTEPIIVNGTKYPGNTMTKFTHLSNQDVAAVATYILNSWGNNGGLVNPSMVALKR